MVLANPKKKLYWNHFATMTTESAWIYSKNKQKFLSHRDTRVENTQHLFLTSQYFYYIHTVNVSLGTSYTSTNANKQRLKGCYLSLLLCSSEKGIRIIQLNNTISLKSLSLIIIPRDKRSECHIFME